MDEKQLIKYDKNFSEYPLWFQTRKPVPHFKWEDVDGFIYDVSCKPPVRKDYLFLLYLLLESQKNGWVERVSCVRANILSGCGLNRTKASYERLEESLKRWKRVNISFSGTFYDNKQYKSMEFGIIDEWKIEDTGSKRQTGKLNVEFNSSWLLQQKHSKFFQMLNFEELKKLKDPLATRLYELLIKQFHNRYKWKIDTVKLAGKIPMQEKYPAHIIPKIKSAVRRISKNTDFQIKLEVERYQRGKALFVFIKPSITKSNMVPESLSNIIPEKYRESCIPICEKIMRKREDGKECLEWIIHYVNGKDHKNFGAYIRFVFENKLYDQYLEQEKLEKSFIEEQQKTVEALKKAEVEKTKDVEIERERETHLNKLINILSIENIAELNTLAEERLKSKALSSGGAKLQLERYLRYVDADKMDRAIKCLYYYKLDIIEDFIKDKGIDTGTLS